MKKTKSAPMFPIRTLLIHPGQAGQKPGGNLLRKTSIGWADSYGPDLITEVNQRLTNGRISARISELWTFAVSRKTSITTTKAGGLTKMYCTFPHIGTGRKKSENQSTFG